MENLPKYVDEKRVSKITGRALSTLRNDRHNRRGIPYCRVGRSIRYSLSDVVEFMESRKIIPKGTV
jgi:Helix-turn-helix domain